MTITLPIMQSYFKLQRNGFLTLPSFVLLPSLQRLQGMVADIDYSVESGLNKRTAKGYVCTEIKD
jgi:hypothetical protein